MRSRETVVPTLTTFLFLAGAGIAVARDEKPIEPAAKVSWDKEAKKIEIENYNALPVDLLNVTAKTP